MSDDAKFCSSCGASLVEVQKPVKLRLASWGRRFVAWLIDIVIVGIIPVSISNISGYKFDLWPFFSLGSIIPFVYWTLAESYSGRSIGKMVMDLKVTRLDGSKIDFAQAALESFGKAFILPIDCIIGWLVDSCKAKRQRMFNKLSNTVVVRVPKEEEGKGVEYVLERD